MSAPQFRTPEVENLYAELRGWDHPEHPFLDPSYSPGSHAPAADFTMYVAQWLAADRIEAVQELWSFLAPSYDAPREMLRKALAVRKPAGVTLTDWQWHELHAVYLLTLRMMIVHAVQIGTSILPDLAAMTIAGEPISLDPQSVRRLTRAALPETPDPSPADGVPGRQEAAAFSIQQAQLPIGVAEAAVARLKLVPPMTRYTVCDYFTRGHGEEGLRFILYYDHRMYGCSGPWNKHFVDWLGFFEPPGDDGKVPAALTKNMLSAALSELSVPCKKSEPREGMVEKARQFPGLLSRLIHQARPEQQQLRAEWSDAVRAWVQRVREVRAAAAGLVKLF